MIPRTSVASSAIASLGYDEPTRTLAVEFAHGGLYHYFDVPPHVYAELIAAPSLGRYVAERIRGVYGYALVEDAQQPARR
jgi:hypothetical protein